MARSIASGSQVLYWPLPLGLSTCGRHGVDWLSCECWMNVVVNNDVVEANEKLQYINICIHFAFEYFEIFVDVYNK